MMLFPLPFLVGSGESLAYLNSDTCTTRIYALKFRCTPDILIRTEFPIYLVSSAKVFSTDAHAICSMATRIYYYNNFSLYYRSLVFVGIGFLVEQ
jgi:hypothetical protein